MYHEPTGDETAGHSHYKVVLSTYEKFMEEQSIPIYKGVGAYDVRQLPLAPWKQMGGRGTFIELDGQVGVFGMYLVEVPAGGVLNPEKHIYEELFLVIEGHGSTEVWREGSSKKQTFEWQPYSHFAIPLNTSHRLVNATSSPALVLVTTSAPRVMESFPTRSFVFGNPWVFSDHYDESQDYFKPRDELEPAPGSGRAMLRSNLIPDIAHCPLPLDNNRGPGHRMFSPQMAGNTFFGGFVAEYPSGRYSKGHYHCACAVLVCLRGKGYSYTWPVELGPRPWEAGKGHLVKRQDYAPGGIVSAVPSGGDWFHQHFSTGKDFLRVRAFIRHVFRLGEAGEETVGAGAELSQGGRAIGYREEDPQILKDYLEALKREGVQFQMPKSVYA
ncbi:MAG: cupin [Chloroflexi bacterium]|nr:cupin [Chloroflexota bacterium]